MKLNEKMLDQLKEIRENLINWYEFDVNDRILEVSILGNGITNNISNQVTFVDKLADIPDGVLFDYVLLEGVLECSQTSFNMNPEELIKTIKGHLKEDGKLLIATDNKLGICNLCSESKESGIKYLGKRTIEKILDNQDFIYRKFYYPLPNYLVPNVIFTDEHLPDLETINRNLTFYDDNTIVALNETKRFRKIIEEDITKFKDFANSFFIECSRKNFENKIEFVAFSNLRKSKYRIRTVIKGDKVYKYSANIESFKHIQSIKNNIDIMRKSNIKTVDSYDENRIISDYQKGVPTLDEILEKEIKKGNLDIVIQLISNFKNKLINSLEKTEKVNTIFDKYKINYDFNDINSLHFVKYGLWDLIFKNCFYIDEDFYFYDQEWMNEDIPIEFILYRAIIYLNGIKKYISKEELCEKIEITSNQLQLFKNLDDILQEEIRDNDLWGLHLNSEIHKNIEEKINKLNNDKEKILNDCKQLLNEKDARISVLEKGMDEAMEKINRQEQELQKREHAINSITNSFSWKMTRPLRKIRSITITGKDGRK